MTTSVPEFRLRCPNPVCGQTDFIQEFRFLSDPEPTPYIVCRVCGWAEVKEQGVRKAIAAGQAVHQRALDDCLAVQRAKDAASNTAREATERQQRIAQAEATIRAWATWPVGDRIIRTGEGWKVHPPDLPPGVALSDLDQAVQDLYAAAVAEAEGAAQRRDLEDAERLAKARGEQPKLWADQAKREQAEAHRRRAERTDVEVSNPT